MKIAGCLAVLAVGVFGIAKADTPSQVWNVAVAMTIPGGAPNPLQGQVYKNFGSIASGLGGQWRYGIW